MIIKGEEGGEKKKRIKAFISFSFSTRKKGEGKKERKRKRSISFLSLSRRNGKKRDAPSSYPP